MKKVTFEPENRLSFEALLEKTRKVLIGLESFDNSGIFIQTEYSHTVCKKRKFLLKEVKTLGVGNGWLSEAKTLQEWKQYFQGNELPFNLFVFENEKEMYQWMLEKVKDQS